MELEELRGTCKGRLFILGNGPSLLGQERTLVLLRQENTFCCNRFCQWELKPLVPTYYACNYDMVQNGIEPSEPPCRGQKFIVSHTGQPKRGWVAVTKRSNVHLDRSSPIMHSGATMPYIMVQIGAYLGYSQFFFLGCEMQGKGHVFDQHGKHHPFDTRWSSELRSQWMKLKDQFSMWGLAITDCTPEGKLNDVLGFTPLRDYFRTRNEVVLRGMKA